MNAHYERHPELFSPFEYVAGCLKTYNESVIDQTLSPGETMANQWYWQVGESAVRCVAEAMVAAGVCQVNSVLDLPCGHGRVLRHLVKFTPGAVFDACDLDHSGVDFCARQLGANPICSVEDLTQVEFPRRYDLIWIGSLFTHVSEAMTGQWLRHLAGFLTDHGVIVATFHGRWSEYVHTVAPYIAPDKWQRIIADYRKNGWGYADYAQEASHSYISGSYGISLAAPSRILELIEATEDLRLHLYKERAWADHQDVVAFGRPCFNQRWPGMP